jgi:hypothetical protein
MPPQLTLVWSMTLCKRSIINLYLIDNAYRSARISPRACGELTSHVRVRR